MRFHSDFPKGGDPVPPAPGSDGSEDGWITIDLDALKPEGLAEAPVEKAGKPNAKLPAPLVGHAAPSGEVTASGLTDTPKLEIHDAQDLGPPRAVARFHGWLERLRPSEPGFLSFERVPERQTEPEPPAPRRVPEADIVFVGRTKEPPRGGEARRFEDTRSHAKLLDEAVPRIASNDDQPGPASKRRKLLLGLALLIAVTGALQALMRSTQPPAVPAVVDVLTF